MPLLVGIAIGLVAALPFTVVARRPSLGMAWGVGAVFVSFLLFHLGVLGLKLASAEELVPAAVLAVCAFLTEVLLSVQR